MAYIRAGARKNIWYKKEDVGAVIVTCGGICPGLNNIIREIVISLFPFYFLFDFIGTGCMVYPECMECLMAMEVLQRH